MERNILKDPVDASNSPNLYRYGKTHIRRLATYRQWKDQQGRITEIVTKYETTRRATPGRGL
jgi:hypothetical protein